MSCYKWQQYDNSKYYDIVFPVKGTSLGLFSPKLKVHFLGHNLALIWTAPVDFFLGLPENVSLKI